MSSKNLNSFDPNMIIKTISRMNEIYENEIKVLEQNGDLKEIVILQSDKIFISKYINMHINNIMKYIAQKDNIIQKDKFLYNDDDIINDGVYNDYDDFSDSVFYNDCVYNNENKENLNKENLNKQNESSKHEKISNLKSYEIDKNNQIDDSIFKLKNDICIENIEKIENLLLKMNELSKKYNALLNRRHDAAQKFYKFIQDYLKNNENLSFKSYCDDKGFCSDKKLNYCDGDYLDKFEYNKNDNNAKNNNNNKVFFKYPDNNSGNFFDDLS